MRKGPHSGYIHTSVGVQWDLRITDTFGTQAILSFVERLSFIGG